MYQFGGRTFLILFKVGEERLRVCFLMGCGSKVVIMKIHHLVVICGLMEVFYVLDLVACLSYVLILLFV